MPWPATHSQSGGTAAFLAEAGRKGRFLLPAASLALAILLAGCAKTGDPQPPVPMLPRPPVDLSAFQAGDEIRLTVTLPQQNTDGSPIQRRGRFDLLRRIEPDRLAAAALGEPDFLNGAQSILSVPADRTEDYLKEGTLAFKDGMAAMDPSVLYRGALRYAVRFSNRKGESAGLSNQAFVAPVLMPGPPAGLRAEVAQDWIRLSWDAAQRNMDGSAPVHLAGYNVYRSEDPAKFPPAPLNAEPLEPPSFDDRAFEFGRTYHYAVSVVGSRSNPYAESRPSTLLAVQPRDTFPPDAPGGLQAVQAGDAVLLLWIAPPQRDIAGYRVSRKGEGAEAEPLSSGLVAEFSFRDGSVKLGRKYQYQVAAVDKAGNTGPAAVVAFELP